MEFKTNTIVCYVKSYLQKNEYIDYETKNEFDFDKKIFVSLKDTKTIKFLIKNFNEFTELNQDFNFLLDNKINYIVFLKDYFEIFIYKIDIFEEII